MKLSQRNAVMGDIDKVVFEQRTPLQEYLRAYEVWAIETAMKRYPTIDAAAAAIGMTRRQITYRLKQGNEFGEGGEL